MPDSIKETKQELRRKYRRAVKAMGEEARREACLEIAEQIALLPEYKKALTVMVYSALPDEVDLKPLIRHPSSAGKRFVYPLCLNETDMAVMLPGKWNEGMYGIKEPDRESSEETSPDTIDLVICPGVAFDDEKTRMGKGRGYYDRYLPRCVNAKVIMAAFELQHAPILPREETDIPMDQVVTERAVY